MSEPTPAVGTALEAPAPFTPLALVRVLRPKQWTKNLALRIKGE